LMLVVDGRLRGQDVIWEFWTALLRGPEFLLVRTSFPYAIALP
jgi:hypothetical protein